ncbi:MULTISPECIES: RecQ family ATP-dependent DNA helicase [unclassified Oceanispirochaeta]|uniref:RecQ family ATP-dependent DNA helicase n=1 Tax=unclassified Oceanispirochaeta TaxID=2635722 RepID=UPI000E090013|nr:MULTISPECIES: RecQ family ATP-dependent DNA helicase [unclassified Oceanispirochaeta]MBF9016999.1 ATP-dependent DNA helicase RecQ [Oceanispirochaeta sp. M2]NPD73362.1 ATP-dependent DNA helicase RecQ [Oceanispirochaeta sp. M1]RDG31020.1 ATP-dependent DNA helicase RecQ [Oceanispirochaeta sp. M1]
MNHITELAHECFGIDYLFPYQHLVITNILRRAGYFGEEEQEEAPHHQVVLLPTGAGKSLCFMLPALILDGLTIVVFPLLGLMADQLRRVEEAGMKGALLKGGMDKASRDALWKGVHDGSTQMLLTNPEMLILPEVQRHLQEVKIAHLVLDEAHTIPEWGESFRPACLELGKVLPELGVDQITAFTATASPLILDKIKSILFSDLSFNLVRANPDRVNIFYKVLPVLSRMRTLTELIPQIERPALIFCSSRRQTEQCALYLRQRLDDQEIRYYHAGLSKELRSELEDWYFNSDSGILCSTCAYGMGMDKSNIRTVIHFTLPSSVEAYLQESGRAGRDRQPCRAILLYHPEDRYREAENPRADLRERYEKLLTFAEDSETCRRESLLAILEAEPEDCDSCDVCRGTVMIKDPVEDLVTEIVQRYRKRFTSRLLRDFLLGRNSREIRQGYWFRAYGFGSLNDWNPDDVKEVISGGISIDKIRMRSKGNGEENNGRLIFSG